MNKGFLFSIGGLVAAAVLFAAVNILAGVGLRGARADLTDGHLYTLSHGSRNIAKKLDEPIRLTLYYSDKQAGSLPPEYKSYGTRVKEVLREYAMISKGKIKLEIISPDPFSDAEDRAVQAGLAGVPTGRAGNERFYFGLVGTNATDKQEVLPFFDPRREEFLEYELTRLIYLLSDPPRKVVGLMSWLPVEGSAGANPMMRQQQMPPWKIVEQAKEVFEVKTIARDAAEIPADVKVLLLIHPKSPSDKALYAIDQFVLKGGHAMVFVDPNCEADVPPGVNPMQAMGMPKNSDLKRLLDGWGVELVQGRFAADRSAAIRVNVGGQGRPEPVDYVAWLQLRSDNLDKADAVTGQLESLNMATSGILQKKDGATTEFMPLVQTSTDSAAMDVQRISFMPDPKGLLSDFVPAGQKLTLGARVTGRVKSAFTGPPEGKPEPGTPPDQPKPPSPAPAGPHVAESAEPINVIVMADCDMLTDNFWVREEHVGPIVIPSKFADNGDLVIGGLDNLSGSTDLISVRARGKFSRPFDKVKQLQRDAEQKFLAKEKELTTKLHDTETKINDLQRKRPDAEGNAQGNILLTPEQQVAIEKFRAEQVQTRKDLREVQHQLRKDIEGLATELRFINVGLMPIMVGAAALGLSFWRASRRRSDRWTSKTLT